MKDNKERKKPHEDMGRKQHKENCNRKPNMGKCKKSLEGWHPVLSKRLMRLINSFDISSFV